MRTVAWLMLVALVACPGRHTAEPAPGSPESVLAAARARVVPDPLKSRFAIKLRSKPLDLAASTNGGLIVDRPGQGRVDLFGPLGGPIVTVASDGAGLSVVLTNAKRQLLATDAEVVIREATGGVASLDDAFAVLSGDLPFDAAEVREVELLAVDDPVHPGLVRVSLDGPKQTRVEVWLDPVDATLRELVALDKKGTPVMSAKYDPYELVGTDLLPTRVELYVPALDLLVETRYRNWSVMETPPETLMPVIPDDFVVQSLEEAIRKLAEKQLAPQ
jgi:hypothetical protein